MDIITLFGTFIILIALTVPIGVALQTSCEKFSYNLQKRNGA